MDSIDSVLHISSFNSIFELLVGFSLAYGGLAFFNEYVNEQFRKKSRDFHLSIYKSIYFLKQLNVFIKFSEGVRQYHSDSGFKQAARFKMIPIFLYGGCYSFFILIIAGLSDSPIEEIIISAGYKLKISYKILFYNIIFILSILSIIMMVCLVRRDRDKGAFFTFYIILSLLIFVGFSILLNIALYDELAFFFSQYFYQLLVILLAIVIGILPIIIFEIWANPYVNARFELLEEWKKDLKNYVRVQSLSQPSNLSDEDIRRINERFNITKNADYSQFKNVFSARTKKRAIKLYRNQIILTVISIIIGSFLCFRYAPIAKVSPLSIYNKKEIETIIDSAGAKELLTYKSYSKCDTSWFNDYYASYSPEKAKIRDVLNRRIKDRYILINNAFALRRFYGIREIEVDGNRLFVRTKEYWFLRWYSREKKRFMYEYQTKMNELVNYEMIRENKKWKIVTSDYIGERKYL